MDQAFLSLSRPGIQSGDPDRVALRLARYALGEGDFSSRLMTKIRTEAGNTYGVRLSLPERMCPCPLRISTFTKVESLGATLALIMKTLEEVRDSGFTETEIKAARGYLHGSYPLRLSTPASRLREAYKGMQAGLGLEDLERDWQALRETPESSIQAAVQRMLGDMDFHLALIGPKDKVLPQVQDWGEALVLPFASNPSQWA